MKKLLLFGCLALGFAATSQTVIWTEDFDSGTAGLAAGYSGTNGAWSVASTGANGIDANQWYVSGQECGNAAGTGGSVCALDYSLHLGTNATVIGDQGAAYLAGGFGFWFIETHSRAESPTIDLTGQTNMTLNFNYMEDLIGAAGYDPDDIGELWYFDGTSWALLDPLAITPATFSPQGTWTAFSIAMPASANNNANVKIGFTWANDDDNIGTDPSFAVDDITISVPGGATNTITTGTNILPTSWCEGNTTTLQVDFTSTGAFNVGNVYTAELSDGAGSFAAPLAIGTLASTANSGLIAATIPGSVLAGTGYRIRVVSSDPVTLGSDNGSDLVVNPLPNVTLQPFSDLCENAGSITLSSGSPVGGTYVGAGVSGGVFNPTVPGAGSTVITYNYTDGNFCSSSSNGSILVLAAPLVTLQPFTSLCINASPITLTGGSPAGGTYSGAGVTGGIFDPASAGIGTATITYTYMSGNGCSDLAMQPLVVSSGATVTQAPFVDVCEDASPVNLIGGSPAGGTYSGTGVSGTLFDPSVAGQGSTNITYTYSDGNGCTGSAVEPVLVIPSPTVTLATFADICNTASFFTITGGSPAGGTYTGPGVVAGVFDPAAAGAGTHTLTYYFTDGNGCSASANQTIIVDDCSELGELGFNPIVLYPNPASQSFQLISTQKIENVKILDMSGRVIKSYSEQMTYDINNIPKGVYFVNIQSSERTIQLRIVIE